LKTLPVDLVTQYKQESHTLTFLFKLDLTSTHSYYWTSFGQKITYLSQWWEPKGIQFDQQNVSLLPRADSISLSINNVDKEFSTLALANEIRGKQVTVYQAALDKNNKVIDSVIIFLGYTDEIEINQKTARVEVYNHLIKWKKLTPRRNHFATCPWVFGDMTDEVTGTDALNYRCVISHVSSSSNRPITGSVSTQYWSTGGSHAAVWSSGTEYSAGTCNYYGVNITINSGGTFEIHPGDPLGTNIEINSGGTFAISTGLWIKGNISSANAYVSGLFCDTGSWAGGDYTGHLYLTQTSRIFAIAETILAAVSSNSSSYSASTSYSIQTLYSTNAGTVTVFNSTHGPCLVGNISGARAYCVGINEDSGTWTAGDIAGSLHFTQTSGTFSAAETLTISASSGSTAISANVATVEAGNSSVSWCDQSYDRCRSLGNSTNFGGFRWLPGLAKKNIVWGRK